MCSTCTLPGQLVVGTRTTSSVSFVSAVSKERQRGLCIAERTLDASISAVLDNNGYKGVAV